MGAEGRGVLTGFALVGALVVFLGFVDIGIPGQALIQSLMLHVSVGLLGLALLLALFRAWWRAGLVLFLVALGAGVVGWRLYEQHAERGALDGTERVASLTVLSHNILQMNDTPDVVADFIVNSGADVAIVLESGALRDHLAELGAVYPYRLGCDVARACDLMILSQLPLTNPQVSSLGQFYPNRLLQAEIRLGDQDVTVMAAHLTKPYFDGAGDYEAWALARAVSATDGPLLLAGDFNSAPWSDAINALTKRTGMLPAPWHHPTWPVRLGPLGVPIDHVLTRAPLIIDEIEVIPDAMGSNHRGLISQISLARAS